MSPPAITGLYAGLLALLFVTLSARVIRHRRGRRISLGDGGDPLFAQRIRAHGNFAEYVPLTLVLLLILEVGGAAAWGLHALGLVLLAGRLAHGWAFSTTGNLLLRTIGMSLTLGAILLAALWLLARAVMG